MKWVWVCVDESFILEWLQIGHKSNSPKINENSLVGGYICNMQDQDSNSGFW
jgi:hypothetical protein